jgi:hypothetical protein
MTHHQIPYRDPAAHHPSLVRIIVQLILALLLGVLAIAIS